MTYMLILLAVALAVSSIGWKYFIYFFSTGYGFSIAALAITIAILFSGALTAPTILLCLAMLIFGCRLGGYLLYSQTKATAYKKILYSPELQKKKPLNAILFVWTFCAILYVAQVSPVAFRLANRAAGIPTNDIWAWIGAITMLAGIALEAAADAQKNASKKKDPKRFVSTGLYAFVRCPNYLGEVVIWTGALISAFGAGLGICQWIIVLLGYCGIIYVMFSGARRLELRQRETYGQDPQFQAYAGKTPILLPFIPLYSVAKYKWLQA